MSLQHLLARWPLFWLPAALPHTTQCAAWHLPGLHAIRTARRTSSAARARMRVTAAGAMSVAVTAKPSAARPSGSVDVPQPSTSTRAPAVGSQGFRPWGLHKPCPGPTAGRPSCSPAPGRVYLGTFATRKVGFMPRACTLLVVPRQGGRPAAQHLDACTWASAMVFKPKTTPACQPSQDSTGTAHA